MLPESLKIPLQEHFKRLKVIHERDLSEGWGRVQMPDALEHKVSQRPERLAVAMAIPPGKPVEEHQDRGGRAAPRS